MKRRIQVLLATLKIPSALLKAQTWYDGMEPQRRILMLMVLLLSLAMVWQNFLLLPHEQRLLRLHATVAELKKSLPELFGRVKRVATNKVVDLNAERQIQITALKREQQNLATTLGEEAGALIQPSEMLKALRQLLADRPDVKLRRLEAFSVHPVQLSQDGTTAAGKPSEKGTSAVVVNGVAPAIYRHDIVLEVEAGYLDILSFFAMMRRLQCNEDV